MNNIANIEPRSNKVPQCLYECKILHGDNQRKALVYIARRMQSKDDYTFSPVELAGVLGITRQASLKMCKVFAQRGIFEDVGNLKVDIAPEVQKSPSHGWHVYGFSHFYVHQFRANFPVVKALFGNTLPQKSLPTITYPNYRQYNRSQVERVLDGFLDKKGLRRIWSEKRGGWIIRCPGTCEHSKRTYKDDTILFTTPKHNGFLYISARCRHESCGSALMEWCKALNKEWGKYFYECQHCSVKPTKRNYKTPIPPANIIPDPVALDPMGECILSFMAKEKAETLLKQVEDADAKLNTLRKQCWRESQYWKKYNDAKYRFMPVYWRYKQAWKPYYELRDSRNDMLKQLQELNGVMEV